MKPHPHPQSLAAALSAALVTLAAGPPTAAQPAGSGSPPPDGEAQTTTFRESDPDADLLHAAFTPYIWFTGFSGTTGLDGLEFDVDQSFLDILDASNSVFGLMGALDLEYKRLVLQLNGAYSHAEFSRERTRTSAGPLGASIEVGADLTVEAGWFEGLGGYRFVDRPLGKGPGPGARLALDGFVGGRITTMEVDVDATAEATLTLPSGRVLEAGTERGLDQKEGWFEPFVGAKAALELGEHWVVLVRGDVGGFGVDDSDFAWQVVAAAGYRWHCDGWTLGLFGGYRALGQDYSRGDFEWDVVTHGPIIGAQFAFEF